MNYQENRRFRQIERSLERDDPEFAARFRAIEVSTTSLITRIANKIMIMGLALTIVGFLIGSPWGTVGMLLVIVGLSLRLMALAFSPAARPRGDDGELGPGHDGTRT